MLVKFFHPQLLTSYKFLPTFFRLPALQYLFTIILVPKHEALFPSSYPALMPFSFQILPFSYVIQLL
jgi:hypothetical protein